MSTNTLLIGAAVVAAVLYVRSQQAGGGGRSDPHLGATPAPAAPGFGFNLGFFKND